MSGIWNTVSPQRRIERGLWLVLALTVVAGAASADENLELAYPGARARAMGGAHTAVAEDLSAMFWNPAGLAGQSGPMMQADTRLSFGSGSLGGAVLELDTPAGVVPVSDFTDAPGGEFTYYLVAAATPLNWGVAEEYDLVGAIGYRRVIDLLFNQNQVMMFDQGGGTFIPWEFMDSGEGGVNAYTLSLAAALHPRFKVGANFNLLDGRFKGTTEQSVTFTGVTFYSDHFRTKQEVNGVSFDLGVKATLLDGLEVGGVFRPEYEVDLVNGQWNQELFVVAGVPGLEPGLNYFAGPLNDQTLTVPTCYSVGASYRPTDDLLIAADFHYRPWDEATVFTKVDGISVDGELRLYETHSYGIGGEYLVHIGDVDMPLRAGYHDTPTVRAHVDSMSADISSAGTRSYRGARVEGHTITLGIGIHFATVQFDVGLDRTAVTTTDFMLETPPMPFQPLRMVELKETLSSFYLSSTLFF